MNDDFVFLFVLFVMFEKSIYFKIELELKNIPQNKKIKHNNWEKRGKYDFPRQLSIESLVHFSIFREKCWEMNSRCWNRHTSGIGYSRWWMKDVRRTILLISSFSTGSNLFLCRLFWCQEFIYRRFSPDTRPDGAPVTDILETIFQCNEASRNILFLVV